MTKSRVEKRFSNRRSSSNLRRITVHVANEQTNRPVSATKLRSAVKKVLLGEGVTRADISLAVVNDSAIHQINRRYLQHDAPTDVISFVLDHSDGFIDGEVVISADTAVTIAKQIGWPLQNEMLLYVIHGALHLVGYDDLTPAARRQMRLRERSYLAQFGIEQPTMMMQDRSVYREKLRSKPARSRRRKNKSQSEVARK